MAAGGDVPGDHLVKRRGQLRPHRAVPVRLCGPGRPRGGSYIDRTIYRDRDVNGLASGGDGRLEERRYYLQNWRNDVVELVKSTGEIVERYRYDAYGRPYCYSPGDLTSPNGYPDGSLTADDNTAFGAAYSGGAGAVVPSQAPKHPA